MWKLGCLLFEAATDSKLFNCQLRGPLEEAYGESGFSDQHLLLDSMTTALGSMPREVSAVVHVGDMPQNVPPSPRPWVRAASGSACLHDAPRQRLRQAMSTRTGCRCKATYLHAAQSALKPLACF